MVRICMNELKNNVYINLLICIQIVIVLVLATAVTSVISYYYKYYNNFKNYFEAAGYLYDVEYAYINDSKILATSTKELEDMLSSAEVTGCYITFANYFDADGNPIDATSIGYDAEIINAISPKLDDGVWLSEADDEEDYIEAVVSCNYDNIHVGDIVLLNNVFYEDDIEKSLKLKIVGVLRDGAKIVAYTENTYRNTGDYKDIYCDYFIEDEEVPLFIFDTADFTECAEAQGDYDTEPLVSGYMFVTYSDDITEEEMINNENILNKYIDANRKETLSSVVKTSKANLKANVFSILPIFIGAFILAIVSSLCAVAVSVKQQMKHYAIYSICGMPWQKSSIISIIGVSLLAAISFVVSIIVACMIMSFNKETTISITILQLLCCVGIIAVYIIISAIMPSLMINGTSINEILRNND